MSIFHRDLYTYELVALLKYGTDEDIKHLDFSRVDVKDVCESVDSDSDWKRVIDRYFSVTKRSKEWLWDCSAECEKAKYIKRKCKEMGICVMR